MVRSRRDGRRTSHSQSIIAVSNTRNKQETLEMLWMQPVLLELEYCINIIIVFPGPELINGISWAFVGLVNGRVLRRRHGVIVWRPLELGSPNFKYAPNVYQIRRHWLLPFVRHSRHFVTLFSSSLSVEYLTKCPRKHHYVCAFLIKIIITDNNFNKTIFFRTRCRQAWIKRTGKSWTIIIILKKNFEDDTESE